MTGWSWRGRIAALGVTALLAWACSRVAKTGAGDRWLAPRPFHVGWSALRPLPSEGVAGPLSSRSAPSSSAGETSCRPDTALAVALPEVRVPLAFPTKPWEIKYAPLRLRFQAAPPRDGAFCRLRSKLGTLEVLGRPALVVGLGPYLEIARSTASVTISFFRQGAVRPPSSCRFDRGRQTSYDCRLNGADARDGHYVRWETSGFVTQLATVVPLSFATGALRFWVRLESLGLSPAQHSLAEMLDEVERYVHLRLIQELPAISRYTVIQDPGQVHLQVTDMAGRTSGAVAAATPARAIPGALYYPSAGNPAVLLIGVPAEDYWVQLTGVRAGRFVLSMATVELPGGRVREAVRSGFIQQGDALHFRASMEGGSPELRPRHPGGDT